MLLLSDGREISLYEKDGELAVDYGTPMRTVAFWCEGY